jgi:hypothetical protein
MLAFHVGYLMIPMQITVKAIELALIIKPKLHIHAVAFFDFSFIHAHGMLISS